ncbi:6573_t:CDS:2 [Ambispora leptoticha]|uniref:6573_t:CDS:1 n=1 Tax=Ambispora leptoticha TaxID=144679 RepID=A0A9N9AUC2_9GLOM|nr:6573_t:CDS:2 [Ambispora leptoticha]
MHKNLMRVSLRTLKALGIEKDIYRKRTRYAIRYQSFHTTSIKCFSIPPNDPPKTSASPMKPDSSVNSNSATDNLPNSNPGNEEPEAARAPEETQSASSKDTNTSELSDFVTRIPRRKRASTSSRARPRITKQSSTIQYKPIIPEAFIKTNYLSFDKNNYSFESMHYPIEDGIRKEILYSARASLLPCQKTDTIPARRGHLLLNCPLEGASFYLDAIVKSVAAKLQADLLIFDRQDLMELTADMFSRKATPWPLFPDLKASTSGRNSGYENKNFGEAFNFNSNSNGVLRGEMKVIMEKMDKFFEALISATPPYTTGMSLEVPSTPRIIYFRDVGDLIPTNFGTALINALVDAVQNQRSIGDRIMIIAGHSPSLFAMEKKSQPSSSSSLLPHEIQWVNLDIFPNPALLVPFTHIAIPPSSSKVLAEKLQSLINDDKNIAIRQINTRNIRAVCINKGANFEEDDIHVLGKMLSKLENIENEVWGFEKVHRLVMNTIGIALDNHNVLGVNETVALEVEHFVLALETLKNNQNLRKEFVENASNSNDLTNKGAEKMVSLVGLGDGKINLPGRKNLKKDDLDRHEKRILSCIVVPEKIQTGFSDIHVSRSTVQTLQTLITLPLIRPQSFSYGVLSKHFISGVLLFGPPGTGKTMLARAVAKESGSTVLDIKASDIYDMFVGEGEKNAIFSLARKLSPCVLFLDEVDAIFNSRRSDHHNGAHREIINQFMAEWDGLTSQNEGVLIMGATNRPFDLDDAILRRMPRRILVDLPNEKDREQILTLHLRDERLDPSVSLSHLAKITNLYSGSDLKNLCISAALAAVREDAEKEAKNNSQVQEKKGENDTVNNSSRSTIEAPPIRILKEHHFQLALKQVTPSCSEDMSSLTELRKWDKQYGDGSWNRKKRAKGMGFDGETSIFNRPSTNTSSTSNTSL